MAYSRTIYYNKEGDQYKLAQVAMHYILRFLFVFLAVALANATQGPIQLNKDNFFKVIFA